MTVADRIVWQYGPQRVNPPAAAFDKTATYRYVLTRTWNASQPVMTWIMLNPSTADALRDDATIRRCTGFARREKCGGIVVINLFAFRATKPAALARAADPVGPDNDWFIRNYCRSGQLVIAGWGAHEQAAVRSRAVLAVFAEWGIQPQCLGVTRNGQPRHPLHLLGAAELRPYLA